MATRKDRAAARKAAPGSRRGSYRRTQVYADGDLARPKHVFKVVGRRIAACMEGRRRFSLLDVGGAGGAFCHHLAGRFPEADLHCLEYDAKLVAEGRRRVPGCLFHRGDARRMRAFQDRTFDVVTCLGVLSIFDDFAGPLGECLRVAKRGGHVLVLGMFNDHPVDALIRYRYNGEKRWNTGYNLLSRATCEDFLRRDPRVASWSFRKFVLPFDLAPQADPIRSWTERDARGARRFVNGLNLILNLQILAIRLGSRRTR